MSVVKLNKISKVFGFGGAATVALDKVSLEVNQGEFVAIMGPSGSGKTTLLNVIGLLDNPSQGKYELLGANASKLSTKDRAEIRRERIGFVFQTFNLLPNMSVLENVALPLAYSGRTYSARLNLASDMLERLNIRNKEYLMPRQLSGGQTQKAAIARALINQPSIIVADEPTGNLDSNSSQEIMDLLREINIQGNTILMVTHNPELTQYANRIIYMKDGQIRVDQPLSSTQQVDLTKVQEAVSKIDHKKKAQQAKSRAKKTTSEAKITTKKSTKSTKKKGKAK